MSTAVIRSTSIRKNDFETFAEYLNIILSLTASYCVSVASLQVKKKETESEVLTIYSSIYSYSSYSIYSSIYFYVLYILIYF